MSLSPAIESLLPGLNVRLGLGLLRLSIDSRPPMPEAIALIHAALSGGVRLLDTADVYGADEQDLHYGERLAKRAVETWSGPQEEVRIATKAGLARRGARWMPAGRPEQLRRAVAGSLEALGVERLFLLQLHARDGRVPFEETLAALAELQRQGLVEHLGLCNCGPAEFHQAERHFRVAAVQNELSVLQRQTASDGMLQLTAEHNIPLLAHRPLGGYAKAARMARHRVLGSLAERRGATPHEMGLAALLDAAPHVVPLVGATRWESVASSLRATQLQLDVSDRTALAIRHSFAPSPQAELQRAAPPPAESQRRLAPQQGPGDEAEVVLLMGIQGAGKSELVEQYVARGYARLNRDLLGGKLDDLAPRLAQLLTAGQRRVVLDNTYPTRSSRSPVIAVARACGAPVRCRFLQTSAADARINVVLRMLARYGRPLGPEEMKACRKTDPNLPPPQALDRWAAGFEPPQLDEGFDVVDPLPFVRRENPAHRHKGLLLDVDGTLRTTLSGERYPRNAQDVALLPRRRERLARWIDDGYQLFFVSNQGGIAAGQVATANVRAALLRTAELLQLPVQEIVYCPHATHPVGCYCRKPMPGLGVYLMERYHLAREQTRMVGDLASDQQFAAGLGIGFHFADEFFGRASRK